MPDASPTRPPRVRGLTSAGILTEAAFGGTTDAAGAMLSAQKPGEGGNRRGGKWRSPARHAKLPRNSIIAPTSQRSTLTPSLCSAAEHRRSCHGARVGCLEPRPSGATAANTRSGSAKLGELASSPVARPPVEQKAQAVCRWLTTTTSRPQACGHGLNTRLQAGSGRVLRQQCSVNERQGRRSVSRSDCCSAHQGWVSEHLRLCHRQADRLGQVR